MNIPILFLLLAISLGSSVHSKEAFVPKPGAAKRRFLHEPPKEQRTFTGAVGDPLYLTPYIESGDLSTAQSLSRVTQPLVGIEDETVESYSGFITVNEENDGHIFFWFFPARDVSPSTAPVSIWLQGGPGSSSLFGALELNGPFLIKNDENGTPMAEMNPEAWTSTASMLYIDNPVGAGFSYADLDGLCTTQEEVGRDFYDFLIQWFTLFEEYQQNDFYLFGESYAGKYIPTIGKKIHDENPTAALKINLKGLGIGSGLMSPIDSLEYSKYLYQLDLVDEIVRDDLAEQDALIKTYCEIDQYILAYQTWDYELAYLENAMGCDDYYDARRCHEDIEESNYREWVRRDETRLAIHVGDLDYMGQQSECYDALTPDIMQSKREEIGFLIEHYPVLLYNGNFDIICNHAGIQNMFHTMTSWSGADALVHEAPMKILRIDGKVAGHLKSEGNLRLALVKNAQHSTPFDQPRVAQDLFTRFVKGEL